VENVKIEGTLDGTSWQTIVESMANTGEFAWTAPSTAVEGLTLRISDAADGEPFGLSGAFSVVKPPTITIKRFGGWEVAEAGSADSIIWTSTGNIDSVKIELTMDQENWTVITESTPNTGRYDWDVPDTTALTCKIRISDAVNGSPSAESKLTFSIQHKTRVLVPVVSGMVGNGFTTQAGILRARFGLAKDASASLRIFAANGRLIATPLARVLPAGYHTIEWNLNEYSRGAAGVYFAELTIDGKSFRRRFFARR
jgi:hypothetical protein